MNPHDIFDWRKARMVACPKCDGLCCDFCNALGVVAVVPVKVSAGDIAAFKSTWSSKPSEYDFDGKQVAIRAYGSKGEEALREIADMEPKS